MKNTSDEVKSKRKYLSNSYGYFFYYTLLPKIGGFLLAIITFVPAYIISTIYVSLFSQEETESIEIGAVIILVIVLSCMILSTWWWLRYLERKSNLPILLPIPFIRIHLKWILYPFMLPFWGIQWLYRSIGTKQPNDNVTSPTTDGKSDKKH